MQGNCTFKMDEPFDERELLLQILNHVRVGEGLAEEGYLGFETHTHETVRAILRRRIAHSCWYSTVVDIGRYVVSSGVSIWRH